MSITDIWSDDQLRTNNEREAIMLSIYSLTVVAYLGDGFILCRKHGETRGLPTKDALSQYELDSSFPDGDVYCDECHERID